MAMDAGDTEVRTLELQAMICQAMADPKRLRILHLLADGERSVGEIAEALGVSVANVSQHLGVLRGRGLVRGRREGTSVYYSLPYVEIVRACQALREVLVRHLAEEGHLSDLLQKTR